MAEGGHSCGKGSLKQEEQDLNPCPWAMQLQSGNGRVLGRALAKQPA